MGVLDDAMATIAEKIEWSEKLERRVDQLMEVETNLRTAWAHWMGTEMKYIHDNLCPSFLKETFKMMVTYKDTSEDLRQQQAPGHSNQPPLPAYPPRQQQQQQQQQKWQPQQR